MDCPVCQQSLTKERLWRKRKYCSWRCYREVLSAQGLPDQLRTQQVADKRKGRILSTEARSKISSSLSGKPRSGHRSAALLPTHCAAVSAVFRSPDNRTFKANNITLFVHSNRHLFQAEDTINKAKQQGGFRCNALHGLQQVHSGRRGSWKGWTLVSDTEVFYNKGEHPLAQEVKQ